MAPAAGRQRPRMCVACRSESPKRALIRIVRRPDGGAAVDVTGRLPGRGAYICMNDECLAAARSSGALSRALKTEIPDECWAELERAVTGGSAAASPEALRREFRSLLGMARRSSSIIIGMDSIKSSAKAAEERPPAKGRRRPRELLILTASDCTEAVSEFAGRLADAGHHHERINMDSSELSSALGASNVQIIALQLRSGLADKIKMINNSL